MSRLLYGWAKIKRTSRMQPRPEDGAKYAASGAGGMG